MVGGEARGILSLVRFAGGILKAAIPEHFQHAWLSAGLMAPEPFLSQLRIH